MAAMTLITVAVVIGKSKPFVKTLALEILLHLKEALYDLHSPTSITSLASAISFFTDEERTLASSLIRLGAKGGTTRSLGIPSLHFDSSGHS